MLLETINQDRREARKQGYPATATLLTTLYSEAQMVGKNDGNRDTTDAEVVATIKKFVKNIDETLKNLPETDPRYEAAKMEREVLSFYLPKQMTEEDLRTAIGEIITSKNLSTPKDMGIVMKELKAEFDGQFDGKAASQLARELLS